MNSASRSEQYLTLFRAALAQSARHGEALLSHVFLVTRRSLAQEFNRATGQHEHAQLGLCIKLLDEKAAALCARFPVLLRQAFEDKQAVSSQFGELALGELSHKQLENMDENQVQERVEFARALQLVQSIAQQSLNELNGCIGTLLGLAHVQPERNPLRPQTYLTVLQDVLLEAAVPIQVRITWTQHLASGLGDALKSSYSALAQKIKSYGVLPLPSGEPEKQLVAARGQAAVHWKNGADETSQQPSVLTLNRLRELLADQTDSQQEVAPDEAVTQFAGALDWNVADTADASQTPDFAESTTDFASTVPAAFEALQNMNQADEEMLPLSQRLNTLMDKAGQAESTRQMLRKGCQSSAQVLSFEVMVQMIDNLVNDTRLLKPIRDVIANLEPALLRLVLVDPRFFNNKQHPARRMLQEITQRGLVFGSADTPECARFIRSLHRYVNPLSRIQIDSAEPFDLALFNLNNMWSEQVIQSQQTVQQAMRVLNRVEERNLLAEKISANLDLIPEMRQVPAPVAEFLCGPWAQVIATAELNNKTGGAEDPGGYKNLVNLLLWSAQPELTRKDLGQLTKLVSRLLAKLREGLGLIDYPAVKTSLFFDALMKLHQQAFRPAPDASTVAPRIDKTNLPGNHRHWLAPEEAKVSGFMEMPDDFPVDRPVPPPTQGVSAPSLPSLEKLVVGSWVEIAIQGSWQRSQLSWISPQRTMYLFTGVQGQTQSMTRPSLENLVHTQALRLVSEHSMVDSALDEVVHTAMRNSLERGQT